MGSFYFHLKMTFNKIPAVSLAYSFLEAAALAPFLAGRAFWDLVMAAARLRAALVRSFLYLPFTITAFTLWRLLRAPAFMVVATRALLGLWPLLALLVVRTKLEQEKESDRK